MPNPTTYGSENNGRRVRHVINSTAKVAFRIDNDGERALIFVKSALAGNRPGDVPSDSAIMRRALALYRQHLDRDGVRGQEFYEIRQGTVLPARRKKYV